MNAGEIEVGQTYRVTEAGLKSRTGWSKRSLGDVFYIAYINGDKFAVSIVNSGWGSSVYRNEIHLFERVGFHPNWNRVRQQQVNWAIEAKRVEFTKAKQLLAELPSAIIQLEFEHGQLKLELADLIQEGQKPTGDEPS